MVGKEPKSPRQLAAENAFAEGMQVLVNNLDMSGESWEQEIKQVEDKLKEAIEFERNERKQGESPEEIKVMGALLSERAKAEIIKKYAIGKAHWQQGCDFDEYATDPGKLQGPVGEPFYLQDIQNMV